MWIVDLIQFNDLDRLGEQIQFKASTQNIITICVRGRGKQIGLSLEKN